MAQTIVAIINQKGGVGKTTTSINLACGIAMLGRKVLLVDLDPQAHSTIVLGSNPDSSSVTVQDVLLKGVAVRDVIVSTGIDNLCLVPSGNICRLFMLKTLAVGWHKHQVQTLRWRLFQTAGKVVDHANRVYLKVHRGLYALFEKIRLRIWEFANT